MVVELVGGESVINGVTPSSFYCKRLVTNIFFVFLGKSVVATVREVWWTPVATKHKSSMIN